ncbi:MAG: hypothetical protein QM755_14080 [Luteolibacter sp.]
MSILARASLAACVNGWAKRDQLVLSRAKIIRETLHNFEADYGKFPEASTGETMLESTGNTWKLIGKVSNDRLRQFIVSGIISDPTILYLECFGSKSTFPKSGILAHLYKHASTHGKAG